MITLDAWFVAAPARQGMIVEEARSRVRIDENITTADMIPVAFVYMPELERSMAYGDKDALLEGLIHISKPENYGYSLDHFVVKLTDNANRQEAFPFDDKMSEILPWWGRISDMRPQR